MLRVMHYCVGTPERGITFAPRGEWDGDPSYKFILLGMSDLDYAKCRSTRNNPALEATHGGAVRDEGGNYCWS